MTAPIPNRHARRETRRRALALSLALAASAWTAAAQAEPARPLAIPAGSLDAALLSLAAQTRQQLLYTPEVVAGRKVAALSGKFTAEAAIARLLGESGVVVTRAGPSVLVLRTPAQLAAAARPVPAAAPGAAGAPAAPASAGADGPRPFGSDGAASPATDPADIAVAAARPTTVEEIQVTGSLIRGGRSASPLQVITRDDLDHSGYATVSEALNALPQNFSGGQNEATINTGADKLGRNSGYGTGVNLHGLGNASTLVLVNGRRMAGSGTYGDFAHISVIPTAAIARVELLLDGASALYGSDAVGGVVNIILNKDFEGGETRLLAGTGTAGEPRQGQLSQTFGRRWGTGGALFSFELQRRDALGSGDRRFTATSDLRPLGGTDQRLITSYPGNILRSDPVTNLTVPGWAIPAGQNGVGLRPGDLQAGVVNLQNQRLGIDVLPKQTLQSLYLAADQEVGDRLEVSADARYGFRKFKVHLGAPVSNLTVNRGNPFFVSPNNSASHTIAYAFVDDLGNPIQLGSSENLGVSLGGKLKLFRDWQADGYLAFAQDIEEAHSTGVLNAFALSEALGTVADRPQTAFSAARDGFFNPFTGVAGGQSPAVLAFIGSGFTTTRSRDRVASANLQADGALLTLPGGPLKLALGGHIRRETFIRGGTNYLSTLAPVRQSGTDVAREVIAGFAELSAPLVGAGNRRRGIERLELSLAGRVERYDDVGTTANPKAGLLWSPAEGLVLRGTYGRSFRAPALREVGDAPVNSPILLNAAGGGLVRSLLLMGGNPGLKPETATSWTLGLDWAPERWPGLTLNLTGFDTSFHDRIDRPVQQNITVALTDPTLASFITRVSPQTSAADLALVTALVNSPATSTVLGVFPPTDYRALVDNRFVNTAGLQVRGLDVTAGYTFNLGDDLIALAANATYILDYRQQVTPTSPVVDKVGVAGFPVRFRGRATADWTRDRLSAGLALNYVSRYRDGLGARIAAQPTVDLRLRAAPADTGPLKGVAVSLAVRNLFDRDPPFYNNVAGVAYDPTNADPVGRFASIQFVRSW